MGNGGREKIDQLCKILSHYYRGFSSQTEISSLNFSFRGKSAVLENFLLLLLLFQTSSRKV